MKQIGYFRELPTGGESKLFSEIKGEVGPDAVCLYARDKPEQNGFERRVVAAANRYGEHVVVSARHHDPLMNQQLRVLIGAGLIDRMQEEQGFVDNMGVFMNREEALQVAKDAGQINQVRLKSPTFRLLFSEDLY